MLSQTGRLFNAFKIWLKIKKKKAEVSKKLLPEKLK